MANAEIPSRVDENAVATLERDWTTEEEAKVKRKYVYTRHQVQVDFGANR
jgi:hypothetical protein